MKKRKPLKPGFRRPLIPQGSPMKSRLDRRAKEREKEWKKKMHEDGECSMEQKIEGLESALKEVIGGILKEAEEERRKSDGYKNLFALYKDGGLAKAVFQAEEDMSKIGMDLCLLIRNTTGKNVDNELYGVISALPLVFRLVKEDIREKEGMSCCADKMRDLVKNYFYRKLGMDVPIVSFEERMEIRKKNGGIDES